MVKYERMPIDPLEYKSNNDQTSIEISREISNLESTIDNRIFNAIANIRTSIFIGLTFWWITTIYYMYANFTISVIKLLKNQYMLSGLGFILNCISLYICNSRKVKVYAGGKWTEIGCNVLHFITCLLWFKVLCTFKNIMNELYFEQQFFN